MNFDSFWNIFPRKVGKISARTAWDKALRMGFAAKDIIDGAQRYAQQMAGAEPQYIKHPDGWLRAGRWMDELPAEKSSTSDFLVRWEHNNRKNRDERAH